MGSKQRLDVLLFARGLAPSRERAQALVLAGRVLVNELKVEKPGTSVASDVAIRLLGQDHPFVSRGGVKLQHALNTFAIEVRGMSCLDVGASTGGFTDCLLQAGASMVYAVDVGYGQLAEKLRVDPRVVNIERTNIRELSVDAVSAVDLCVIDASFISLRLVLPSALPFVRAGGQVVALVKPQFEVGREHIEKGGVVRSAEQHSLVLERMRALAKELALRVGGIEASPITGAKKGNVEYLAWLLRS